MDCPDGKLKEERKQEQMQILPIYVLGLECILPFSLFRQIWIF